MRPQLTLRSFLAIALPVCIFATVAIAQNDPTIDTYNPNQPYIQPPLANPLTQDSDEKPSLRKTTAVTIPQAFVRPVIDGVMSSGEWTDAIELTPALAVTQGSGTKLYLKNDACYLYIAGMLSVNSAYSGNSNMMNIWFDVDNDGTWDGSDDGNLALPAPGIQYQPNQAAWGYNTLTGWTTSSTARLRYHRPWSTPGVVLPEADVKVRITNISSSQCIIEAQIDYANGSVKLPTSSEFGLWINTYSGYYTGGGTVQIQTTWPSSNTSTWFNGPTPSELEDTEITAVLSASNSYDVDDSYLANNPNFGSKAYETGSTAEGKIEYTLNVAPPEDIDYRARFYGPYPSNNLAQTHSGSVTANNSSGTATVTIPVNVPVGFYVIEFEVDDPEDCGIEPRIENNNALIIGPGQIPCTVFPGDVNNDGIVNYGDKMALNNYIHDANLNPTWLQGYYRLPPRYPTPLAALEYVGQAAIPWQTALGCHMDSDGNSVVNSFDNIAIRMNWFKTNSNASPKGHDEFDVTTFSLDQNYPNPFNPSTQIRYNAPEKCDVSLRVMDAVGREVAKLVHGTVAAGVHVATFDASDLSSGTYVATIQMTGVESGLHFTKSIKMLVSK
ncbi:MAG: hypothetical protein CL946_01770 [Ectothiorhodospiraceae bacterium]|nr:hypothetical protein [Ectothiorhodospiraceae bacterium]